MKTWSSSKMLLGIVLLVATIVAPMYAATPAQAAEPPVIRFGQTPFFDYQFATIADQLGWDTDLGVDLQLTWFPQQGPVIQALVNGSMDIVPSCNACAYPWYETVPQFVHFATTNQFKGFIVVGRKDQITPYSEFLTQLGDAEKAKQATIAQFKGKTIAAYYPHREALIRAILEQGGLTMDDIFKLEFPDDEKAALAMVGGTGDLYLGGLPGELNLLMNHPDKFINVGGHEIMGAAGLWYSQIGSSIDWLAKNEDSALKLTAMMYRFNRYVQEKPDTVLPLVAEAMNAHSGVAVKPEDMRFTMTVFLEFRTYQGDRDTTYNPESELYWAKSAEYYVVVPTEGLPANADYRRQNPLDEWFAKLLERKDLLEWIDKPLE
jgi:ABC-type nitrate/sulfonate/bicarbonate transport system substrate-binding protein